MAQQFTLQNVGGAQGLGYTGLAYDARYGFSPSAWYNLNRREQELVVQDFNRTKEQITYYQDSDQAKAYEYVQFIDKTREQGKDLLTDVTQGATKGIELAILAVGLAFLATRK
jgi:hypothetical protein